MFSFWGVGLLTFETFPLEVPTYRPFEHEEILPILVIISVTVLYTDFTPSVNDVAFHLSLLHV